MGQGSGAIALLFKSCLTCLTQSAGKNGAASDTMPLADAKRLFLDSYHPNGHPWGHQKRIRPDQTNAIVVLNYGLCEMRLVNQVLMTVT